MEERWEVNGSHYARTSEDWVRNLERRRAEVLPILAETYGAEVRLARVKPHVLALMRRDGVIARLGEDHLYGNLYEAARDRVEQ